MVRLASRADASPPFVGWFGCASHALLGGPLTPAALVLGPALRPHGLDRSQRIPLPLPLRAAR